MPNLTSANVITGGMAAKKSYWSGEPKLPSSPDKANDNTDDGSSGDVIPGDQEPCAPGKTG
jgi:hypothetical protein